MNGRLMTEVHPSSMPTLTTLTLTSSLHTGPGPMDGHINNIKPHCRTGAGVTTLTLTPLLPPAPGPIPGTITTLRYTHRCAHPEVYPGWRIIHPEVYPGVYHTRRYTQVCTIPERYTLWCTIHTLRYTLWCTIHTLRYPLVGIHL